MSKRREATSSFEDNLKAYFSQIKKARLLTFEEELDLSRRIQKGDESARRLLIEVESASRCPNRQELPDP